MAQDKAEPQAQEKQAGKGYQAPAVIYDGVISTRAGSPTTFAPEKAGQSIDPADLFGD